MAAPGSVELRLLFVREPRFVDHISRHPLEGSGASLHLLDHHRLDPARIPTGPLQCLVLGHGLAQRPLYPPKRPTCYWDGRTNESGDF